MVLVLLFGMSVCPSDHLKSNAWGLLPEVCLGPRNNRFDFGDDPDYDLDRTDLHQNFSVVSRSIKFWG